MSEFNENDLSAIKNLFTVITVVLILCSLWVFVFKEEAHAMSQFKETKQQRVETMLKGIDEKFPSIKQLSVSDIENINNYLFVDVRENEERKISKIPSSISLTEFLKDSEKYFSSNKAIVFYCTIGYRSSVAAQQFKGKNVANLRGSLISWAWNGKELVDSKNNKTKKIHVYGRKWDLLPEAYSGQY